jgi:hypothetical protein
MPHPGLKVAHGASCGATCDLKDDFVKEMKVRIEANAISCKAVYHLNLYKVYKYITASLVQKM